MVNGQVPANMNGDVNKEIDSLQMAFGKVGWGELHAVVRATLLHPPSPPKPESESEPEPEPEPEP